MSALQAEYRSNHSRQSIFSTPREISELSPLQLSRASEGACQKAAMMRSIGQELASVISFAMPHCKACENGPASPTFAARNIRCPRPHPS